MTRRLRNVLLAGTAVALLSLAGLLAAVYVFVGDIGAHRTRVESYLSSATGGVARIAELSSTRAGIVPEFRAVGVRLRDAQDRQTLLRVGEMRLRPKLLPLLLGQLAFRRIVLERPTVELVRREDGRITLGELEGHGGGSPLGWLLAQQQVTVSDGTLVWHDRREPARPLTVRGINLALRGQRGVRQISGSALPPDTLSQPLRWDGSLSGALEDGSLAGILRVDAAGVDLAQLPAVMAELLPVSVAGVLDLKLTLAWRESVLAGATAQVLVGKPEVRMRGEERQLRADRLAGALELGRIGDGWRLRAWRPEWVKGAERFAPEEITVERAGTETSVAFKDVDLEGLSDMLHSLIVPGELSNLLAQLRPQGRLQEGTAKLGADWRERGPLALQLRYRDLSFEPRQKFPGVSGLDGTLDYVEPEGRARIESERVTVELPKSHPLRIDVERLAGDVSWERTADGWAVRGENLDARNADAEFRAASFALALPSDPAAPPTLKASAEMVRVEVPRVSAYVPAVPKTEKFRKWYERALHAGRAVAGHIETEGSLDRFPYEQGGGRIAGWARVEDAVLDFEPGFPVVHAPLVAVGLKDAELSFGAATGRLDNAVVREARVALPAIFSKGQHVLVEGRAEVALSDGLAFLEQGPLFKDEDVRDVFRLWKADGKGELRLKVDVPLKTPKDSRVEGSYEFSSSAALFMEQLEVKDVKARVQFTDRSATAEARAGEFLGGPAALKLRTAEPGRPPKLVFDLSGTGAPARIADAFLPELSRAISGTGAWTGRIETAKASWKATLASNLNGVTLDLPEPLRKAAASPVPLSVEYSVREGTAAQLAARLGDRAGLALALTKTSGGWRPDGGEIVAGERRAASAGGRGLRLRLRQRSLDLDSWLDFASSTFPEPRDPGPLSVVGIRARAEQLRFLHRSWGNATLTADSPDGVQWRGALNGERFAGSAQVNLARGSSSYQLALARLYVPPAEGDEPAAVEQPGAQPTIDVTAEDFRFGDRPLGRLEFHARPQNDTWQVETLTLRQPSLAVSARGAWAGTGAGESRFEITAESGDFGAALKALAIDQRVEGAEGKVTAQLRWPGAPGRFSKAQVEGEIEIEARRGRFLAMESAAGRVFGLLNLDALTRRLRLDFSDVFGKGTQFDQFGGKARLGGGDLHTDGIIIVGPSLYVEITGRIGLVREDFDLDLIVAPPLGGNLSLIGAVINPIYGAVMYLTQKVFRKQLARLLYYRYRVVGPWDQPEITRAKHEPEPSATE